MGWLDRWDAANQAQAEHDRDRFGGDDWADRLNEDRPLPIWHVAQQAVVAVALAVAAVVAVIVVLVRVIASAG